MAERAIDVTSNGIVVTACEVMTTAEGWSIATVHVERIVLIAVDSVFEVIGEGEEEAIVGLVVTGG